MASQVKIVFKTVYHRLSFCDEQLRLSFYDE